jgi:hypothetical protein
LKIAQKSPVEEPIEENGLFDKLDGFGSISPYPNTTTLRSLVSAHP